MQKNALYIENNMASVIVHPLLEYHLLIFVRREQLEDSLLGALN